MIDQGFVYFDQSLSSRDLVVDPMSKWVFNSFLNRGSGLLYVRSVCFDLFGLDVTHLFCHPFPSRDSFDLIGSTFLGRY